MTKIRKDIWLIVLIGLIFPALMFILLGDKHEKGPAITLTQTQTTAMPEQQVCVQFDDGSVQSMELEEYIICVVLREMPATFELEALKAQAIVARTYTLRRVENGGKHKNAAICTNSSCCQAFITPVDYLKSGGEQALLEKVIQAVQDTKGNVITYENELIDATYFSCSGGSTEDAVAVWGTDVPYLKATQSPGEEKAAHYVDTVTFSKNEFLERLSLNKAKDVVIGQILYTDGGGIKSIMICGKRFRGTDIRKKLGLRSTSFVISAVGNMVSVTTKGFGHRVGMSQYGAEAMAVGGSSCYEILTHYYQGVHVVKYPI